MAEKVAQCFSPADSSMGTKSLESLTGEAAGAYDPFNVLKESDPRAQKLLAQQQARINQLRGNVGPVPRKHKQDFRAGDKVFHKTRNIHGMIAASSLDGKRIEVVFGKERKLVQLRNLVKS